MASDRRLTRACAHCEVEFGVKMPEPTSHGVCRRHYLDSLNELAGVVPAARLATVRQEAEQQPDCEFSPDMSVNYDG